MTTGKTKDQLKTEKKATELQKRKDDPEYRAQYWRDLATELFDAHALHLLVLFHDNGPNIYRMVDIPLIGFGEVATVHLFELQTMLKAFGERGYANTFYQSGDKLEKLYVLHRDSDEVATKGLLEWVSKKVPTPSP